MIIFCRLEGRPLLPFLLHKKNKKFLRRWRKTQEKKMSEKFSGKIFLLAFFLMLIVFFLFSHFLTNSHTKARHVVCCCEMKILLSFLTLFLSPSLFFFFFLDHVLLLIMAHSNINNIIKKYKMWIYRNHRKWNI